MSLLKLIDFNAVVVCIGQGQRDTLWYNGGVFVYFAVFIPNVNDSKFKYVS